MGNGYYDTLSSSIYTTTTYGVNSTNGLRNFAPQEIYRARDLDPMLNPRNVYRECCDSEDHPNSLPVILGLDVTGSMGKACAMCASKLDEIMTTLYKTNKDVEFCMMGIGDFACDNAPLQVTQFESDVRILDQTTKLWLEGGGGGNGWESYTAAWYFGLNRCKLDCWNKGERGIIITMGDEPLNSYLPWRRLHEVLGGESEKKDVNTLELYKAVSKKYDIYHIAITNDSSYGFYKNQIEESWRPLLGDHLLIAESDQLPDLIAAIVNGRTNEYVTHTDETQTDNEGISW